MIGIGEVLDNFIGVFAPAAKLRRMQARRIARSYQGAEPNRLTANRKPKKKTANQEILGPFYY